MHNTNSPDDAARRQLAKLSILRIHQVEHLCGLKKSTIYKWMKSGDFPKSINLGGSAIGWLSQDITQWIESRISTNRPLEHGEETV